MSIRLRSIVFALVTVIAGPSAAGDSENANRLFVAAVQAWHEAAALQGDDLDSAERRLDLFTQVQTNLATIISDYSGSELAVRLVIGAAVGPLSTDVVQEAQLYAEQVVEEQRLLLACRDEPPSRICVMAEAAAVQRVGQGDDSEEQYLAAVMAEAAAAAQAEPVAAAQAETEVPAAVLAAINLGQFSDALDLAHAIDNAYARGLSLDEIGKAQVSANLVREGNVTREWARLILAGARAGAEARARADAEVLEQILADVDLGQFSEATNLASTIADASLRGRTLGDIAKAQTEADLFTDALTTARSISDTPLQAQVLGDLAKAQAEAGLFSDALATAHSISNERRRDSALEAIAGAQAQASLFADALETARAIVSRQVQDQVFWNISEAQASAGLFNDALSSARSISYAEWQAFALEAIAHYLPE